MLYLIGVVVIFLLIILYYTSRSEENALLRGFWTADAEFCERAGLQMFVMYIGNSQYTYLLAANESGIILNNPAKLCIRHFTLNPTVSHCKDMAASLEWIDDEPEDSMAFPKQFRMAFYPTSGKLVLYQKDTVLAILWKDCKTTAINKPDLLPTCLKQNVRSTDSEEI
jgi:hypothetical protein